MTINVAVNAENVAVNTENVAVNAENVALNTENVALNAENVALNTKSLAEHLGLNRKTMQRELTLLQEKKLNVGLELRKTDIGKSLIINQATIKTTENYG